MWNVLFEFKEVASVSDNKDELVATGAEMNSESESQPDAEPTESDGNEVGQLGELDLDAEVVDLNHQRLANIDERIQELRSVEVLTLRWNMIKVIENLAPLVTLKELEFYDNQITVIENLDALVNLE